MDKFTKPGVPAVKPRDVRGLKARSNEFVLDTGPETLTQQHFANEVDVNTIVRRFGITGQMPFGSAQGVYGDFTGIESYEDAVAKVEDANERFMKLPPEVRDKFNNSPAELIRKAKELPENEFNALFVPVTPDPVVP